MTNKQNIEIGAETESESGDTARGSHADETVEPANVNEKLRPEHTSRIDFILVISTMNPSVHARSLGLCPTPAARTVLPSLRAISRMAWHCNSVSGSKTAKGLQLKLRPQFVNLDLGEPGSMETGRTRV